MSPMTLSVIFPGTDARLTCLCFLEQSYLSSWTQEQQLAFFPVIWNCLSVSGPVNYQQEWLRMFFNKSHLSSVIKCTWSVDLKMCNFSNCSEFFQVTLESIFRDWQGRRTHQAVCWNLLFITDLGYRYCPGTLILSSMTQAKGKAHQKPHKPCSNIPAEARKWLMNRTDSSANEVHSAL